MGRENGPIITGEYRADETSDKIHILLPGNNLAIAQVQILFRGFFMTELALAGFGKTAQVTISAILYGLVHSAWGFTSGMFTMQMMGGAIVGTAVFGVFCSTVYLVSRRSLMPVIVGHAAIDFVIEPWLFMVAITMAQVH